MVRVILMFTVKRRQAAPEAPDLEGLHREGLHHAEAGDRLLQDLRDVTPAPERGLARRAQVAAQPDERVEGQRDPDQREQRELPVLDEEDRDEPDDGQALLQEVAGHLGHRVLDLLHVGGHVAHEGAGAVAAEEAEGLVQHVLVEVVAQVGDRALAGGGDHRRREERAQALDRVEGEKRERHRADVDVLDEDVVEDRLDHVDDARSGRGVTGGGDPRRQQHHAVRAAVAEEPSELSRLRPHVGEEAGETPAPARRRPSARPGRPQGRDGRGCGDGDGFISLHRRVLTRRSGSGSIRDDPPVRQLPSPGKPSPPWGRGQGEGDETLTPSPLPFRERGLSQSTNLYLMSAHNAGNPSRHVIFLPSE